MPRRRRPPRAGAVAELPPLRLATQIATLQALYYVGAIILMLFTALVAGASFTLDFVFGWEAVRGDTTQGWLCGFVLILDGGFCMAIAIILLVSRSKLVPDFAVTIHGLHLIITTLYTGRLPRNAMWWACMIASAGLCAALGVWGSRYRELRPIYFGGSGGGGGHSGNAGAGGRVGDGDSSQINGAPAEGDEEQGFSRGRGRDRGRDGTGEYEMVGMKAAD
ncbi:hypothetical protein ACHAQH_003702 [Verticillium albo-atrum]